MKPQLLSAAVALLLIGPVNAQTGGGTGCSNVNDPACSKSFGAPVGREAVLGSILGSTLPPEPPIAYSGPLILGETLPDTVIVYPVPEYDDYSYTAIGPHRVILDRRTRHIVRILD